MIKGLQKTTLIDYPGKIACTIFLGGCNFRCGYCYNYDLVVAPNKIPSIDEEEIRKFLYQRKNLVDGVCITGGEPTLHENLPALIEIIKEMDYKVKLDTNGTNPKMLKELLEKKLIDYVAMDIKCSLESYKKVVGVKVDKEKLKESIQIIKNSGIDYEFRTTVIPDIIDEKEIEKIGKLIKGSKNYYLQQFAPHESTLSKKYNSMKPLEQKKLEEFKKIAEKYVKKVGIRNLN